MPSLHVLPNLHSGAGRIRALNTPFPFGWRARKERNARPPKNFFFSFHSYDGTHSFSPEKLLIPRTLMSPSPPYNYFHPHGSPSQQFFLLYITSVFPIPISMPSRKTAKKTPKKTLLLAACFTSHGIIFFLSIFFFGPYHDPHVSIADCFLEDKLNQTYQFIRGGTRARRASEGQPDPAGLQGSSFNSLFPLRQLARRHPQHPLPTFFLHIL